MSSTKHTEAPTRCQLHSIGCQNFCESPREVERELCQQCLEVQDAHRSGAKGPAWHFGYTNYRGEYSQRRATPVRFEFQSTEHHPEKQWIMHAVDHDKGAMRAFALADIVFGLHKAVEPSVEMMEQGSTVSNYDVSQAMAGNIYRAMEAMRVIRGMPRQKINILVAMNTRVEELEQMVADLVAAGSIMLPERKAEPVGTWSDMGDAHAAGFNECLDEIQEKLKTKAH